MLAPICLFTYKRLFETRKTIQALQNNFLATESDLIIFSDGGNSDASWAKVKAVREYIRSVSGFKSIQLIESEINVGLANSIITGVTQILDTYGKVIVLEDDVITTSNFLDYMNQCLNSYENNDRVLSISGFSFSNNSLNETSDVCFGNRASSWGWATWKNRWEQVDWEVKTYKNFQYNLIKRWKFNRGGSDMSHMLGKQMSGKINSWAIRFCYHQFEHQLVDVYPIMSKVSNIGFGENATNSKAGALRFRTTPDTSNKREFLLPNEIKLSKITLVKFRWRHSIPMRAIDRLNKTGSVTPKELIVFHPALAPYRVDFFNQLASSFSSKFYFSLDNPKEQKFNQKILRSEINFQFNLNSFGFELFGRSVRFGVWHILAKYKPNIVICSEYSQSTISVLLYKYLFKRELKVFTISDDSIDLSIKRVGVRKWIRNICSNWIDGIIFPSKHVSDWYKIHVNSHPKTLELPIIHSNEHFRDKLSNALNYSAINTEKYDLVGKKVFLFVGRLVEIKNIDLLIRAFANAAIKSGVLIIVGDGEEKENLIQLAERMNLAETCIFTGRLEGDELLSWYNIAQCFILPSYIEPYGAVVNEALLAGCKVLCSNLAGASELITNENGCVFDPIDEHKLKELIQHTANSLNVLELPVVLKPDLMPFLLKEKIIDLVSEL
jgi:glycosyltransferase involved in cell wall biosynthesis